MFAGWKNLSDTMKTKLLSLAFLGCVGLPQANAQSSDEEFEQFRKEMHEDYQDFRKQMFKEYTDFIKQPWKDGLVKEGVKTPEDQKTLPEITENNAVTNSWLGRQALSVREGIRKMLRNLKKKEKNAKQSAKQPDRQLAINEVIKPKIDKQEQPQPIAPIKETTVPKVEYRTVKVYGTEVKVRMGNDCRFTLGQVNSVNVGNKLSNLMTPAFDNLLFDCLKIRKERHLSDWAYLQMLKTITYDFYGPRTNESMLVLGYLYLQSGYKMRFYNDGPQLGILIASSHSIYGNSYLSFGDGEKYYVFDNDNCQRISYADVPFPKEKDLSLRLVANQKFDVNDTPERTITSLQYPEFSFTVKMNKNLINFYNNYPNSYIGDDFMTRWATYANAPMDEEVVNYLYPQIREKIKGMSAYDAASRLLNWVQSGFNYQYDDVVWGEDRAFFGEETLYYPYCDCEDRSILFSHLVRDLLDLDVVLVYYPGHLATAVAFNEPVEGDYFLLNGRRFTVCDPTLIVGNIGTTMSLVHHEEGKVILLERTGVRM